MTNAEPNEAIAVWDLARVSQHDRQHLAAGRLRRLRMDLSLMIRGALIEAKAATPAPKPGDDAGK